MIDLIYDNDMIFLEKNKKFLVHIPRGGELSEISMLIF